MIHGLKLFLLVMLLFPLANRAQNEEDPGQVRNQVYDFLIQQAQPVDSAYALIKHAAWEALAYLEEAENPIPADLQEAVPDYYNFKGNTLVIKLVDPETNEYGVELNTSFRIANNSRVLLIDGNTGSVRDEWTIIALDGNYLALDMGELKVFFTHTPAQE